jgi:hypothetical protein
MVVIMVDPQSSYLEAWKSFAERLQELHRNSLEDTPSEQDLPEEDIDLSRGEMRSIFRSCMTQLAVEQLHAAHAAGKEKAKCLADALQASLKNPAKAAEAFGFKRRRGRPRKNESPKSTQWILEMDVPALLSLGLSEQIAKHLAKALRIGSRTPTKTAYALGIQRARGRSKTGSSAKYMKLAQDVHILRSYGVFALPSSNRDRGIYERVASARHVHPDTVERAWKRHRAYFELRDAFEASLASHPHE